MISTFYYYDWVDTASGGLLVPDGIFKHLNYLALQSFDYEHAQWRLSQRGILHTKLDIYVVLFNMYIFPDPSVNL
jgi:hypothetical protein